MGKSRVKKVKSPRSNPIGAGKNTDDAEEESFGDDSAYEAHENIVQLSTNSVKSLLQQLQSSSVEDRDCACNALAALIRNSSDVNVVLKEGATKILGPLVLDTNYSVCHSASAALHALISVGGDPAIKLALEHDILTPLLALLRTYPADWKPKENNGQKINTKKATFMETVGTLVALSDSSSTAVDRLHRENIVSFLIRYLDINFYGADLVSVIAQCLCTITEDQGETDYCETLRNEICTKLIDNPLATSLLKTLGVGILLNLCHGNIDNLGVSLHTLIQILTSTLALDHRKAASLVMDYLPISAADNEEDENAMDSEQGTSKLKDAIESAEDMLSSQIRVLEILTNLLCPSDSDSDYEDYPDEDSGSEESGDVDGMNIENLETELTPELKENIIRAGVFLLVLDKANFPAENVCQALSLDRSGKSLLCSYEKLQCCAFLCLNNLCMSLHVEEMGGSKELFDIWCNLGRVAFDSSRKSDQILEAATTSMRAIIQKLLLHHNDIVHLMKTEDVSTLCQQLKNCNESRTKVNLVQILGTLGSMAAGTEAPLIDARAAVVRIIGSILTELFCQETDIWIAAEALDAIFDVFKEDHTDGVAVEIQLVQHLKSAATNFKQRVHAQRRSLGEHQPIVMMAKDNLLRFIKYKSKQRR